MFHSSTVTDLFDFIRRSPTPWHAVAEMSERLAHHGFIRLSENMPWTLSPGARYFCIRDDGSLAAFQLPSGELTALRMIGAHTDSPTLRFKPHPVKTGSGWASVGIEVYGGALLAPWFDRDLGVAGRVFVRTRSAAIERRLLHVDRALAVIPNLAIHLDREANQGRGYNAQTQMAPVMWQAGGDAELPDIKTLVWRWLAEQYGPEELDVLDFNLAFHDVQPPVQTGLYGELISSARLDNLLSCYCAMRALVESDGHKGALMIVNDHEEVGSASAGGAQGTFLSDVVSRIAEACGQGGAEGRIRLMQASRMISCDNAHGVHPAWPDKHDPEHRPQLNKGPVIKINESQRYATSAATSALFRDVCREAGVPVQTFVSRADMPCGTTIGPLTSTRTGVPTLDIGLAQWAMHSIRETAGAHDPDYLIRALTAFCNRETLF